MSKHTPGPWEVEYDDLTEEWVVHWPDGYAAINGLMNGHQAQLIAAAPEMLAALEEIAECARINGDGPTEEACNKVIWKAKGETG